MGVLRNKSQIIMCVCLFFFVLLADATINPTLTHFYFSGRKDIGDQPYPAVDAPYLSNLSVTPKIGDVDTLFKFTAVYYDEENDAPLFVNITINETSYTMEQSDIFDLNYTDGAEYSFTSTLDLGLYHFHVNCNDSQFAYSTPVVEGPEVNPFVYLDRTGEIHRVAIFQNSYPQGMDSIQQILTSHNISYDQYSSWDMGSVALDSYDKVIIPSFQDWSLYNEFSYLDILTWFEAYVAQGGVLQVDCANYGYEFNLPGGYACVYSPNYDLVLDPSLGQDPLIMRPNVITAANIAASGSAYCFIGNGKPSDRIFISYESDGSAALMTAEYGEGSFIYTGMRLERSYYYGYYRLLENAILYGVSSAFKVISPKDSTFYFNGRIRLQWASSSLTISPITYRIQLSRDQTFDSVLMEMDDIVESPNRTAITFNLGIEGDVFWRFRPEYGNLYGNWEGPFLIKLFPRLTQPPNQEYFPNTHGNRISWNFRDYPIVSYRILQNGAEIVQESGNITLPLQVDIDGLSPGTYNFTLIITDIYNITYTDTVIISVVPRPFSFYALIGGSAVGFLGLAYVLTISIKKGHLSRQNLKHSFHTLKMTVADVHFSPKPDEAFTLSIYLVILIAFVISLWTFYRF